MVGVRGGQVDAVVVHQIEVVERRSAVDGAAVVGAGHPLRLVAGRNRETER